MKILLSAYGCQPNRGSDTEVGWQWAINLARSGHKVWVITRPDHRSYIDDELSELNDPDLKNLKFIYFDVNWFVKITNWIKFRHYFYYYLWQWKAYRYVKELHKNINFDIVHHVTWVSVRQPSFMGGLGIPFIFGPVAGGEHAPYRLRKEYGFRQWFNDLLRDIANMVVKVDPFMRYTFRSAKTIYVTSNDTRNLVPRQFWNKVHIRLAIGMKSLGDENHNSKQNQALNIDSPRLLFVGRFVDWKGMHIGIRALAKLKEFIPGISLTMIGKGGDEGHWRVLAEEHKVADIIEWVPWVEQEKLSALYAEHDLFIFPSLHDSGGLVVLEAMRCGLPVACLNLGGPGVIVDSDSGVSIDVRNKDIPAVANDLASSIREIITQPETYIKLSKGAINRVESFKWDALVDDVYTGMQE